MTKSFVDYTSCAISRNKVVKILFRNCVSIRKSRRQKEIIFFVFLTEMQQVFNCQDSISCDLLQVFDCSKSFSYPTNAIICRVFMTCDKKESKSKSFL